MIERVINIISEYQGIDSEKINEKSNLITDIGLSSFDIISLACKIEEEFNIEIPDRKIKNLTTIKDIVEYLNSL